MGPQDVVRLLAMTISELREGIIDPPRANSIGVLTSHLLKAFEVSETHKTLQELQMILDERSNNKKGQSHEN